jgi:hypothetical protein
MKTLKHGVAIMIATALTALAVYGGVEAVATTSDTAVVSSSGTSLVCPATGCTASTCHGATGTSASSSAAGSTGSGSSTSRGTGTLTCPRTGCTASTCHATQGGGSGRHFD